MNKKIKYAVALMTLSLTACNSGLKNSVNNNLYNSAIWENNYYREYDSRIANSQDRNIINLGSENKIFTSFVDNSFKEVDSYPSEAGLNFYTETGDTSYSNLYKTSNNNPLLKDGYTSKLFDGKMYCFGRYEKVRVQIDETGFGMCFNNYLSSASYFAMNFKIALDFKSGTNPTSHLVNFDLNIGFYFLEDGEIVKDTYTYNLIDLYSNAGETYYFFGFSFDNLNIENAIGMSVSYSNYVDIYRDDNFPTLNDSLLIYEVILANSTWR